MSGAYSEFGARVQERLDEERRAHRARRRAIRWRRFIRRNFIVPGLFASATLLFFGGLLFRELTLAKLVLLFALHAAALILLFLLFWTATFVIISKTMTRGLRYAAMFVRNTACFTLIYLLFPHQLLGHIFEQYTLGMARTLYGVVLAVLLLKPVLYGYVVQRRREKRGAVRRILSGYNAGTTAKTLSFLTIIFSLFVFESWFLAQAATGDLRMDRHIRANAALLLPDIFESGRDAGLTDMPVVEPFRSVIDPASLPDEAARASDPGLQAEYEKAKATAQVWLTTALILCFVVLVSGGVHMRVVEAVLATAIVQIRKMGLPPEEIVMKASLYAANLRTYLLREYPISTIGGFFGSIVYLAGPLLLLLTGKYSFLSAMMNEDTAFFAAALIASWMGPLAVSLSKADDVFGLSFNRAIADIIMKISDHIIYFGYGDLGKRVVERDVLRTFLLDRENNFTELITPDLVAARLCVSALVIDHSDNDFLYAAESPLLGRYGVVAVEAIGGMRLREPTSRMAGQARRRPWQFYRRRAWQYSRRKIVLLPALKGDLAEPFAYARANLERARLLISTVEGHAGVSSAFDAVAGSRTRTILCTTRSDQIPYLTYRASTRRLALLYPTAVRGASMGHRLWAAIRKVGAARGLDPDAAGPRPRIFIIGESKARHYLLENLWMNIPGTYETKTAWIRAHVAILLVEPEEAYHSAELERIDDRVSRGEGGNGVSRFALPVRFMTGGRYTGNPKTRVLDLQAYNLRHARLDQLDLIFQDDPPDVIVMNPEYFESSLSMMQQTVRALERLGGLDPDTGKPAAMFPLVLFTLLRGNRQERITIGDLSRYYNSLLKLYGDPIAGDESYPAHAYYSRNRQQLVKEAIIDANADPEEMIAGIHESLFEGLPGVRSMLRADSEYLEINSCVPNIPGTLAQLTAHLSCMAFAKVAPAQVGIDVAEGDGDDARNLPSFQYLRAFQLDLLGRGLAVTGYADLAPVENDELLSAQEAAFFERLYVTNGIDYNSEGAVPGRPVGDDVQQDIETDGPTVPEAIDYITGRSAPMDAGSFRDKLLDPDADGRPGSRACPGMNTCPVASYQDYLIASNRQPLGDAEQGKGDAPLRYANNYHCRSRFVAPADAPESRPSGPARLMVCARAEKDEPGILAFALNALLFRELTARCGGLRRPDADGREWIFNIQYLKDSGCHNRHFGVNRIFGYWEAFEAGDTEREAGLIAKRQQDNPIQLVEILPVGEAENAVRWFHYARRLAAFFNYLDRDKRRYRLVWFDRELRSTCLENFAASATTERIRKNPPVAIAIYKQNEYSEIEKMRAEAAGDYQLCQICGLQGLAHSCVSSRPWFKEFELSWQFQENCGDRIR